MSIDDLKQRILTAKGQKQTGKKADGQHSQASLGMQILTELIASLIVGAVLGYWLDVLFGSKPVMFIIFVFIGIITGLTNAFRVSYGLKPLGDPARLPRRKNTGKDDIDSSEGDQQ